MNNAEYRFTLDLQKVQSQVTLQANSGDTARTLLITLTNGGLTHKLGEGSTAVLSAKKSNGKYLFNSCSIVEDNTVIRYDFTPATTDTPGITQCEILITDPVENTIISPRFTMIVDDLINDEEVMSEDENTFIVRAMAQEGTREVNEAVRVSKENERVANEEERTSNEATRVTNETERQEAEVARAEADAAREVNEKERKSNEEERLANEVSRQEAEQARAEADAARGLTFNSYRNIEKRVANLELASDGKLYNTVTLEGTRTALQVDEALPYGILSRIGGAVKKVTIGLPYSLDKDKLNVTKLDYDSFIVPGGAMPWFPCKVPVGATITASYTSERNTLRYYSLFAGKLAGKQVAVNTTSGVECTPESDNVAEKGEVAYIGISRTGTAAEKAEPDTLYNLRVMFADPSQATIETVIDEIVMPNDVIPLLPGAIVKFYDENGEPVSSEYTLTYKNKL